MPLSCYGSGVWHQGNGGCAGQVARINPRGVGCPGAMAVEGSAGLDSGQRRAPPSQGLLGCAGHNKSPIAKGR